jgi:hypothetical protein
MIYFPGQVFGGSFVAVLWSVLPTANRSGVPRCTTSQLCNITPWVWKYAVCRRLVFLFLSNTEQLYAITVCRRTML